MKRAIESLSLFTAFLERKKAIDFEKETVLPSLFLWKNNDNSLFLC